jgi:transcriptional regulator with PAS, ATPase and Fis domain
MTALALASGGVMARTEFEALAALSGDAEPIGTLARTSLAVVRSRLVERTPTHLRSLCKKTLRQLEAKLVAQRSSRRQEVVTTLSEETLKAKEELGIVGSSPALLRAIGTVARAARSDTSMVITGETGAGKELFARLAHRLSRRKDGPFVALNCAAIPEPLLEAELFGHERGAFTGAERSRTGLFVEAEHGTLFLDEVGEMSPGMQAKLLRVLEDGQVRPVGGTRARKVDVRVITATHRDLSAMVESRQFREDLFYRLAALTVRLPALRERAEDIPAIARALLHRDPATRRHKLDVSALAALAEHSWPGNVRELANVMRVAAAMADERTIGRAELSIAIGGDTRRGAHGASPLEETTLAALRDRHRAEVRELVGRAIAAHDGNKLQAARALGISRQGLYRVLEEIGE